MQPTLQAQVQVLAVLEPDVVASVDAEGHLLQWGLPSGTAAWHLPTQRWALPKHISLLCPRFSSMPLAACSIIKSSHLKCEQHHSSYFQSNAGKSHACLIHLCSYAALTLQLAKPS